jgi:hypothetical protein
MAQPVSSSNSCVSYLANSPTLLQRGAYCLIAIAAISMLAGILAITGHLIAHPFLSKIPLAAGITMVVVGAGVTVGLPFVLKKILRVGIKERLNQLEKDKAAGKIEEPMYSMHKLGLLMTDMKHQKYLCCRV